MPASARCAQVDLSATPYYHCISRCVRRAFLCGDDAYTGRSYDHRKAWFLERLDVLASVFCIDICAYAVMSNHFHVVLRVDADRAAGLTDEAVLRRYGKLFPTVARQIRELPAAMQRARVAELRERLTDISWFMRSINEHVARRANKEDGCRGRFWEGRFKSQPLLDEVALYTCMAYVDLNPTRAGMCESLEGSEFTSVQQRLREAAGAELGKRSVTMARMGGEGSRRRRGVLGMRLDDYLELLEWTGRAAGKKSRATLRGERARVGEPPALLASLHVNHHAWLVMMSLPGLGRLSVLGKPSSLEAERARRGKRWLKGTAAANALYRGE